MQSNVDTTINCKRLYFRANLQNWTNINQLFRNFVADVPFYALFLRNQSGVKPHSDNQIFPYRAKMNGNRLLLQYIRQLFQLILMPERGWEDVSASVHNPDILQRKAYIPLLVITALSEFIPLIYSRGYGFISALLSAIVVAMGMFSSLYVARLILEMTYCRYVDNKMNPVKLSLFTTFLLGINCIYIIITNACPASMTFLRLLPLLSVVVIFKATKFLGVAEDNQLSFTGLSIIAVIACPAAICGILMLIV